MGASSLADPPLGAWDAESGPKRIAQLQDQLCSLRTEWELQARRSRQLLAAFQLKLEEKEMELRTARLVVDRQMRDVTTNLLQVEANLRREKRLVLELLAERDQLIRDQRFEMGRLKALNKQLMQEKLNGSSSTTSPSSSSSSTTIMSNGSSSPSEIAESVISRDSTNLNAAAPHATPTKAATNGGIQANGCKRWRSDSDVLTPNMKVVRVGSAVSFLLNKSECSESHSSTEDLSWQKGKQRSWQLPSSQANSSSSCSIVNTISHVLDSTFSSSSSSPAAVSNNISSPPNTSSSSSTPTSSSVAAGDGRGSDPNSNEDSNRLLSSSSSSSCLHADLMSPDAALLDDSLDQSDSGFFSSSGQRTPEAGVPTPPLPARSHHHHHHHHPQNNKPPWIPPKPDHLVTKLKGIKAGKEAKVASSVVSKGKLGGILKKTSVSEPNLLSSRNLVMKEAVPKRPSKTRLTLSTSSGNLTEGIVQANFEEFHLDFPPAASPSSTSSSGSDYHSTTSALLAVSFHAHMSGGTRANARFPDTGASASIEAALKTNLTLRKA
ncbi:unnamed protein product [Notodromas monacha]|uniref:Uncharacterized protein n=1 Tax=Notodromas monacha TaxID=399045 RepID=A0A7R9GBC4_9CRUS|nr:unnamed protein product [Notodromas monacha]CAG0916351.1 unnamed protein product [Notodromas monacha]